MPCRRALRRPSSIICNRCSPVVLCPENAMRTSKCGSAAVAVTAAAFALENDRRQQARGCKHALRRTRERFPLCNSVNCCECLVRPLSFEQLAARLHAQIGRLRAPGRKPSCRERAIECRSARVSSSRTLVSNAARCRPTKADKISHNREVDRSHRIEVINPVGQQDNHQNKGRRCRRLPQWSKSWSGRTPAAIIAKTKKT